MEDKDGKIRLRLAEDIINDQVGGAGWMHLDIALQVDKYSPKTVLVKTRKCDAQGKIVLEPKAQEKTSNYLVPKDANAVKILDDVSVQAYPKEASWKQTYSYVRSVSGNVSLKAVEAVGFSAEGSKTNKRCVETTCTDLEHRSVDIEDLRSALSALTAQTSAEGIRNETSFLVVTDVLVGSEVCIVETQDSKKHGKVGVDAKVNGVGIEAGVSTTKEKAASLERSNIGGIILAIKLARVYYDEQGTIERDGVVAGGSYDGNYTLGAGNKDRERHYTVRTLARLIGVKRDKFDINVSLLGRQNSTEVKVPQDVCETGLHQTRKSHPVGSNLLPLKGIRVSKSKKKKHFLACTLKRMFSSEEEREVKLSKVMVTDLERDQTYICPCSEETAVTDDRSLWFDCKQWREEVAGKEFQVIVEGTSYYVHEEDPIVRVFGDQAFDNGRYEISWTNAEGGGVGRDVPRADRTFKDYGIRANAVIKLIRGRTNVHFSDGIDLVEDCELELTFEACELTLRVGLGERIDTLPEKVLSLLVVYHGGQKVTDVRQRLDDLGLQWDDMEEEEEDDIVKKTVENPNKLLLKIEDAQTEATGLGVDIQVAIPAGKLTVTVNNDENMGDVTRRLCRVYARMSVFHDGKMITDLTQTYCQLGIQAAAHVQLKSWDQEKPPVVPSLKEVLAIEEAIESLIQELQGLEQGNTDSDTESESEEQAEEKTDWSAVRRILWRHLDIRDGDPNIRPEALKMLIRAVGENSVAGEVLLTILEAALEQQGEGGMNWPYVEFETAL
ncbi:Hypp4661 [Branchiostoma lanceolatum]|uniref:Hypp4661 protein n=1 Tax=Branchiostoma lanceolatum TaxID=7740 RepID=A0A8K0F2A1_BRALA|nr:Hypp4661 [Branchiostoma lanceolatum]